MFLIEIRCCNCGKTIYINIDKEIEQDNIKGVRIIPSVGTTEIYCGCGNKAQIIGC